MTDVSEAMAWSLCEPFKQRGHDHLKACSYFAKQCFAQKAQKKGNQDRYQLVTPKWKLRDVFGLGECLLHAYKAVDIFGPSIIFMPPNKSPSARMIEHFKRDLRLLDPNNVRYWAVEREAKKIFAKFGLIGEGEDFFKKFKARPFDTQASAKKNTGLFIVLLDFHKKSEVDVEMEKTLKSLRTSGLDLIGSESFEVGRSVSSNLEPPGRDVCNSLSPHRFNRLACMIGGGVRVVGVEDRGLYNSAVYQKFMQRETGCMWVDEDNVCDCSKWAWESEAFNVMRSYTMIYNLLKIRKNLQKKAAVLIIGAGHLADLQKIFRHFDVNYVALAVPSVLSNLNQMFYGLRKGAKKLEEQRSAIDELCR